jgi:demethylmenaquinone methyltransferase/2-methoxy-6-polyprenyl-1,4-benzoquinol methylase
MFDQVVSRYDVLNDVLSLGFDRRWRRKAAAALVSGSGPILDLGCGTGRLGERVVARSTVIGVDLSHAMLLSARSRLGGRTRLVEASAYLLPFGDGAFAGALSGFVLRNLDDLPRAFAELGRVLRPGGGIAMVDITEPTSPVLRRVFDAYFAVAAPAAGAVVGKRDAYRYLVRSLAQLPPPREVCSMLEREGFRAPRARTLAPGMVTLWTAVRA